MANERQWNAVGPVLLTANGTTEGVLQVTDTAGFYFDMQCQLLTNTGLQLTVYIKNVVNSTTLWVGAKKGGLDHNVDVSAFTTALNSTISAGMQNKSTVPIEGRMLATYETDPVNAWRNVPVDSYGNHYTSSNTFPVNIIPTSGIAFTLGSLLLPSLVTNLLSGLTYDSVTDTTVGNEEILTFYSGGNELLEITLTKTASGWILNLGTSLDNFLLLESGALIELENGSGAILLE